MIAMTLRLFGREPTSIFALLGTDENSATFALGWAIDRCPSFRNMLVKKLVGRLPARESAMVVELQRYETGGITDIELISHHFCHVIIEAKCGWTLPSRKQLAGYSLRMVKSSMFKRKIVSLSAVTQDRVAGVLPKDINGVPVVHYSWEDVRCMVDVARKKAGSHTEKRWLHHLFLHLGGYVAMQNQSDNKVFVVSLGSGPIKSGSDYTWIDAVEKDKRYFHPVAKPWPNIPSIYIGFRYKEELQSVHHIDKYKVVRDLSKVKPQWPDPTSFDNIVYTLGPQMKPARPMKTGSIYRTGRVWCMIDTLLSGACGTISDARDETQRRSLTNRQKG